MSRTTALDSARRAVQASLRGRTGQGLTRSEHPDPIGRVIAGLGRLAGSDLLDRFGVRHTTERTVFTLTAAGFRTAETLGRSFAKVTGSGTGERAPLRESSGVFDLTPTEDEQMLVGVAAEYAADVLRPAAAAADDACAAPPEVLGAGAEIGLPLLGLPESLGGIAEQRSAMAGALVLEALGEGDLPLAVAAMAPGAVATAIGLWGSAGQQSTYLPEFTGDDVPAAALALTEAAPLFDPLQPQTSAVRRGDGFVLDGVKSMVPRGAEAELFVIGAMLDSEPRLFLVESACSGLSIEAEPSMGIRAASLTRVHLDGVEVAETALLGTTEDYIEAVGLARLGWCALAVGTCQAVLDYVKGYVTERTAFGEPIAHRQSVAFMVADMAIELQGMRLVTYKAASRVARGEDATREIALARRLVAERAMRIGLDGVQLLGGHGFVKEHPVERWYRDLRALGIVEGGVLI